jgi:hypothetical protein
MQKSTRTWLVVTLVPILAVLIVGATALAFLVGKQIGATPSPTRVLSPTRPFPTISTSTATPRPTSTSTPVPATSTPTPTSTRTPTPTATPTPRVIISEVRSLGRLETAKYLLETVIDLERQPTNLWEQVFGTDKLMLVASGEVVAGFDLTKVDRSDVTVHRDSVRLVLPPPEVLYTRVDNERTYVYERTSGLFRRPDARIETEARVLAEQSMLRRALEGEILRQAEHSGRLQLEVFLRSLGFAEIEILVRHE